MYLVSGFCNADSTRLLPRILKLLLMLSITCTPHPHPHLTPPHAVFHSIVYVLSVLYSKSKLISTEGYVYIKSIYYFTRDVGRFGKHPTYGVTAEDTVKNKQTNKQTKQTNTQTKRVEVK